jgi:IS5 family transposase
MRKEVLERMVVAVTVNHALRDDVIEKTADSLVAHKLSEKATRNHPLTEEQRANNRQKAKIRCQVEHVFAGMVQMVGGTSIRSKNLSRAKFNISLLNLLYNMRRVLSLTNPTDNWLKRQKRLATG